MSMTTGTITEMMFGNVADYNAVANTAVEASLLAGPNEQPSFLPPLFYNRQGRGRAVLIEAMGVLSSTGTPTLTFQARLSATQGTTTFTGASVGVTAALTLATSVTNKWWRLWLKLICSVPGQGSGNATVFGAGFVQSPGGLASPFVYPLEPTTPDTAAWTQTFDAAVAQYLNLSATWSAAAAGNTITTKMLTVMGLN